MTLFAKYKQTILYLIFGVLSTIVNILTYAFCTRNLNIEFLISNWIAWIVAVLFAYITNKFFVFESKKINIKKEFIPVLFGNDINVYNDKLNVIKWFYSKDNNKCSSSNIKLYIQ